MKRFIACAAVFACLVLPLRAADELKPIEADEAQRLGKLLADQADKMDKTQIKVTADPNKASGLHVPHKVGILVVPQKELRESDELAAKFKLDKGAAIAYLFLHHLVPVIDGQPLDTGRLHAVDFADEKGDKHKVQVLLLAVRQAAPDDYRLLAYGPDEKPLVDAKFSAGAGLGAEPIGIEIKDIDAATRQGKVVLTVFGKYQAGFTCQKAD